MKIPVEITVQHRNSMECNWSEEIRGKIERIESKGDTGFYPEKQYLLTMTDKRQFSFDVPVDSTIEWDDKCYRVWWYNSGPICSVSIRTLTILDRIGII